MKIKEDKKLKKLILIDLIVKEIKKIDPKLTKVLSKYILELIKII